MPIYEYRCHNCKRRVSVFWRTITESEKGQAICPRCGSADMTRLVSRVRVIRSEESRLENLSDPGFMAGLDESDPRSVGRMMRRMADEMGEDMGPEFDEAVGRLEAGESPEEIERSMPDLLGGESEPGFDDEL